MNDVATTETQNAQIDPAVAEIIEQALRGGARLHAFLSGGGLRVVRVERSGSDDCVGYGEDPHIEEALAFAAEDIQARADIKAAATRMLGDEPPHYLTGARDTTSPLDAWIRTGSKWDAYADDGSIVVELRGYEHQAYPDGLVKRATAGETIVWESRGYTFKTSPTRFPNGDPGCSTETISRPAGRGHVDDFSYHIIKTGRGPTLDAALTAAFAATAVEITR